MSVPATRTFLSREYDRFAHGNLCTALSVAFAKSGGRFGWLVVRPTSISPLSDQRVVIGVRRVVPIPVQEGACVMSLRKDDWIVYTVLLPALLALEGVGGVAARAWHTQTPWHVTAASPICAPSDGYVEGLAKRGIAKLPGYEVSPADELSTAAAAVAASELRA